MSDGHLPAAASYCWHFRVSDYNHEHKEGSHNGPQILFGQKIKEPTHRG